ncbi:hypothetical protein ABB02_00107 [Clostridiaceae bacterium JG1575]|nr:hypothetical protein ABB02_00107 [Clostridiaceae bacterium JG1575]
MDPLHFTPTEQRNAQHRSLEHRVLIQTRPKDGRSPTRIAKDHLASKCMQGLKQSMDGRMCQDGKNEKNGALFAGRYFRVLFVAISN